MGWEDDVLVQTARSRNIDIQLMGCHSLSVLIKKAEFPLKVYARAVYYSVNILRINVRSRFKPKKTKAADKEIVFQLCSSAYKHVENIVPLMKALKHKGYNPVALCWHANERYIKESGTDQVQKEGLRAEELEKWCSFFDMWKSISGAFWTWKKAKGKKSEFLSHPALNYQSVPLGSLLWPSVRFFIIAELAQSYRLRQALKNYFNVHTPLAIKLWGGVALREGFLMWKSLDPKNIPLMFFYTVGAHIDWPYKERNSPIDLLFVAGENHKKMALESNGIPSRNIKICGQARYEGLDDFRKKYSAEQSRIALKIPLNFATHIFLDTGYTIRGFLSTQEQAIITSFLLKFASKQPSVALIIKPHPGHKVGTLESLIDKHALKNVFLVDKNMLPYHALNAADMLITKYSTIGIEAMLFERPVISVLLDCEERWKIFGEAAEYVNAIEALDNLLTELIKNSTIRSQWTIRQIQKQKFFLNQYIIAASQLASDIGTDALDALIRKQDFA
jgi:hypothetical protein